jgi:mannosyltransferase OCH1-like enzyme
MNDLCFEDLDQYLLTQKGKIIHQIWFGTIPNKKEAKKAFKGLRKYRDSWLIKNPNWMYMCWDLNNCDMLVKKFYTQHLEMYKKYPYQIQKCDVVRYFILHRYGGLYADMDYYCNRSFDDVLENYQKNIYLVETPNKVGEDAHISNSLMYSKPNHVFWQKLFIELEMSQNAPCYYSRHVTIMFTTGPGILNRVYNKYKILYKLDYYPYKLFHPFGLTTDIILLNNKPDIYAMHIGRGGWEGSDSKFYILVYKEYKILLFIILTLIIPTFIHSRLK